MIKLVRDSSGDWIGIYIDGKLVDEGHSLPEERMLDALSVEYTSEELDMEANDLGRLPKRYEDI